MYLITEKGKAVYSGIIGYNDGDQLIRAMKPMKSKFRLAQVGNDSVKGIVYKADALDIDESEYDKRYTVKIRTPIYDDDSKLVKLL